MPVDIQKAGTQDKQDNQCGNKDSCEKKFNMLFHGKVWLFELATGRFEIQS
jgi:hypothetical protein